MSRHIILIFLLLINISMVNAEMDLTLTTGDIYIEQDIAGGYHLWIRKKPDINSVLITDSSADPQKRFHSYALRNPVYHPVNGDEKRMLNGEFLDQTKGLYSLIDSTPEQNEKLGMAFHIYIPYIVIYGYPWSRMGEIQVLDGTFLNIRSFSQAYANYEGSFLDNPFEMQIKQKIIEGPPEDKFMAEAIKTLKEIAEKGDGDSYLSLGEEDLIEKIDDIIEKSKGENLDLVLAIDTTMSMHNEIPFIKKDLISVVNKYINKYKKIRVGVLYYRDYRDRYLVKALPFEEDQEKIQHNINSATVHGGRDIPEAVYEALYSSINSYEWQADKRLIILVGDAPPHPRPRGKITAELVFSQAKEKGIEIHTIILPQ
jgi:septum formation topological specificity factor MinE